MNRDDVTRRSEGILDVIEVDLLYLESALSAADWREQARSPDLCPERVDERIAQIRRLDEKLGHALEQRRDRCRELVRRRLSELGVESGAAKLEDLVAQLTARAWFDSNAPEDP